MTGLFFIPGADLDNDLEFDYTSKKKKSKKRVDIEELISDNKKESSPDEKEKGLSFMSCLRWA